MADRLLELFGRYKRLVGDLTRFGMPPQVAEDAAQEAMIETWKRFGQIAPAADWSYARATAFHRAINQVQRIRPTDPLDEQRGSEDRSVEARLIEEQERARIRRRFDAAMRELSDETRYCLVLKGRGLRSKEMARLLGLDATAVRSRISRAIQLLAARMTAEEDR